MGDGSHYNSMAGIKLICMIKQDNILKTNQIIASALLRLLKE